MNQNNKYDDIIHLSRPASPRRARMSMIDRGAQFSPFAALVGYDAAIAETESDKQIAIAANTAAGLLNVFFFIIDSFRVCEISYTSPPLF